MLSEEKRMMKNEQLGALMEIANGIMSTEDLHSLVTLDFYNKELKSKVMIGATEDEIVIIASSLVEVAISLLDRVPENKMQLFCFQNPEQALNLLKNGRSIQQLVVGRK